MKPSAFKDFKGSIDDLLDHCSKVDANEIENLANGGDRFLSPAEAMDCIAEEFHVSKEKARELYMDILIEEGLVHIVGNTEDGRPIYSATDKGMEHYREQLRRENEKNS